MNEELLFKLLIIAILWFIAGLLTGEQETILMKYAKTWISGDWWNKNLWKYENPIWQWIMKVPLSFMKDGFHFCKSAALILKASSIPVALGLIYWQGIILVIGLYIVNGTAFNISFHDWITKFLRKFGFRGDWGV